MSSIYFSRDFFTGQSKDMEKVSPNRAQFILRKKYTVCTVAHLSPIPTFYDPRATDLQLRHYLVS